MDVAKLEGALLDYWVARAGEEWKHVDTSNTLTLDPSYKGVRLVTYGDGYQAAMLEPNNPMRQDPREFNPSTNWSQGGPIIERSLISVIYQPVDSPDACPIWEAFLRADHESQFGPTPLIAAMRAYVASKFGETVEDI